MPNPIFLLISLCGAVVLFFAVFWKREGGVVENIVDSFISADDPKDRSPRAWFLLLGVGLMALGVYLAVR